MSQSLQVCHCGWSKHTTFQGLRTHQGKKGCTPKGLHIIRSELSQWGRPQTERPFRDILPAPFALNYQSSTVSPIRKQEIPSANQAAVLEHIKYYFQTPPPRRHQPADVVRRVLEFSTDNQQEWRLVEHQQMQNLSNVKKEKAQILQKPKQTKESLEILKKIRVREQKLAEVKLSARTFKGRLDGELLEINNVFTEVMEAVKEAWTTALHPLEKRRLRVKTEAQALVDELQKEIQQLQEIVTETEQQINQQSSPPSLKTWNNVELDTSVSLGSLRVTTASMMSQVELLLEGLDAVELRRIPAFTVDVKLDAHTAHQHLVFSDDLKTVSDGGEKGKLPDNAERFDMFASILGLNVISGGKAYWEVGVADKSGWDLGVARRDAVRKGKLKLDPDNGYWVMVHYEGSQYAALLSPPIRLSPRAIPEKVGVFVDYEDGLVSFYDLSHRRHIYSFTGCSFGTDVLPYFSPHLKQQQSNAKPLIISSG